MSKPEHLKRTTFSTSRLMDFCSEKELVAQCGHSVAEWPLVCLKEPFDNALDAAEEAGIAPEISVSIDEAGIVIADNGPGIPEATIESILDFSIRVSSREAYVSPTRGAQGNALKTILAMPFVLSGGRQGRVDIDAQGTQHKIEFAVDQVRQRPAINHVTEPSDCKIGTKLTIHWPSSASSILIDADVRFSQIAEDYAWLNPHLTLRLDWYGEDKDACTMRATNPEWMKWGPSDPTSPFWYTPERLARLIGAYVSHDIDHGRARTVREFVSEFRGLSGSAKQKQVLDATGLARTPLSSLVRDNAVDPEAAKALLDAMKALTKPIKAAQLGVIGRDHFEMRFWSEGCEMDSFAYFKIEEDGDDNAGIPFVVEAAFAWTGAAQGRRMVTGINFAPTIINPFRQLAFGQSLDTVLSHQRVSHDEPVIFALHITCPRVEFTDRAKSSMVTNATISRAIEKAAEAVTKKWAKQRKREERETSARANRRDAMTTRERPATQIEAAADVLPEAWAKASGDGKYPASARQIYYAARTLMELITGRDSISYHYFSQTLLVNFVEENDLDWDITFDARGEFSEPHGGRRVPLGTLQVRYYLNDVFAAEWDETRIKLDRRFPTIGPENRFGAILFIEKSGFEPLLKAAGIANRFDIGIMSTKGMSVVASRKLAEELCSFYDIPLLVLRDCDISGFTIGGTLSTSTRRYAFTSKFKVVDLGLRLADAIEMGLEPEPVILSEKSDLDALARTLRRHGATEAEVRYLLYGDEKKGPQRVELNAMTSPQFIEFLERKLVAAGVAKIVPDRDMLELAARRAAKIAKMQEAIREIEESEDDDLDLPDDLEQQVKDRLEADPKLSWDIALLAVMGGDITDEGDEDDDDDEE